MPVTDTPDPNAIRTNAHHWARFRRLMRNMAIVTATVLIATYVVLWRMGTPMPLNFMVAFSLGIFCMVMLTGALMGLSFVSSATGHDEEVVDPVEPPAALDHRNGNKPL
jgi:hypothetical protein